MVPREARTGFRRSASPMETPPEETRTSQRERAAVREAVRAETPALSLEGGRKGGREEGAVW